MTSVPCASGRKGIVLYENGEMQLFEKECLACEYHGTGDTFDGVFVGAYLNNKSLEEIIRACSCICICMYERKRAL